MQQVRVVAHTTHNRPIPITTQPDFTSPPHNLHHPFKPNLTNHPHITSPPHTILFTSLPKHSIHPSIYPSLHLHTHPYTDAYTLTRLIVNKLLTLYIYIDILTFMWYNKDNGKGPFYMLNI